MFKVSGSIFNSYPALRSAKKLALPDVIGTGIYSQMFISQTNLLRGPYLRATTSRYSCYYRLFKGCSNLNEIKIAFTGTFSSGINSGTVEWVDGVSSTGKFYYNGSDTTRATYAIPTGWTITSF